jgi:hypothetical protein
MVITAKLAVRVERGALHTFTVERFPRATPSRHVDDYRMLGQRVRVFGRRVESGRPRAMTPP